MMAKSRELSNHILPASGTMIGVCTTLIGLVKVVEGRIGPSRVDEYVSLVAVMFVFSAIASYISIRYAGRPNLGTQFERAADYLFLLGLLSIAIIAVLFAYEAI
jgi:hypothetical protein